MLFIGDVHITSKHSEGIRTVIRQTIDAHPEESTIIFLGDYVYHFSYDRKALLELFRLFLDLVERGKTLYVLSGNHDWIAGHFVFEEARQLSAMYSTMSEQIQFITQPTQITIENQDVLFFPFCHHFSEPTETYMLEEYANSKQHTAQLARYANNILCEEINKRRRKQSGSKSLMLIHHRYIAATAFPGQVATFPFNAPALSPHLLDEEDIIMVSGHLHQPFCYKNYICTGSMRHTSPLEVNQQKYVAQYTTQYDRRTLLPISYNPYISLPRGETPIDDYTIETHIALIRERQATSFLTNKKFSVEILQSNHPLSRKNLSITLTTETIAHQDPYTIVNPETAKKLASLTIKQHARVATTLLEELDSASLELHDRFSDRKILLQSFLEQKFGQRNQEYNDLLQELGIL